MRSFDLAASVIGLVLLSPVFLLVALAIVVLSPGPVFFRQVRVGRYGQPFTLVKFRSMVHRRRVDGPLVTASGDNRITPLGRWLRRTKMDELPQLWNVVCGHMALVGPRPEVPRYVDAYPELYAPVLRHRPGITSACTLALREEERLLQQAADPERFYLEEILPRKIEAYRREAREQSFGRNLRTIVATVLPRAELVPQVDLPFHGLSRRATMPARMAAPKPRLVALGDDLAPAKIRISA